MFVGEGVCCSCDTHVVAQVVVAVMLCLSLCLSSHSRVHTCAFKSVHDELCEVMLHKLVPVPELTHVPLTFAWNTCCGEGR